MHNRAEYIIFPSSCAWWLDYYEDFSIHLESHYHRIAQLDDGTVLYSLAVCPKRRLNRFSVVICTFRRSNYIGKAIESLFQQKYPRDKFEIIVVNNDSPDNTEQVVKEYAERSPVPFKYLIEKRNGLSYARNLGIAHSEYEYVAHLDDDATACPNWLASFNSVINEQHALVVGGRVEKVFEPGFVPPTWFNYQYMQGFFGLNYREWGKKEKVFRIRYPRYIGGGNSVYAKWLYDHFGGYDPRLGRDGRTLLAAEETYLNLVLDRHDVPIYYSDDAVIYHFIESNRITKKHVRAKARWGGVSNAIMYAMLHDRDVQQQRITASWTELRRLVRESISSWTDPKTFSRHCRIRNLAAFLARTYLIRARQLFGNELYRPAAVEWSPARRLREINDWPDGIDKDCELYHFQSSFGTENEAERACEKLRQYASLPHARSITSTVGPCARMDSRREYQKLRDRVRFVVEEHLPTNAAVIVVSKGDDELLSLGGRRGYHFPQIRGGQYAGYYPAKCDDAIECLEAMRAKGGTHLLFPSTSLWWLDHYPRFRQHLEEFHEPVFEDADTCVIFKLNDVEWQATAQGAVSAASVTAAE